MEHATTGSERDGPDLAAGPDEGGEQACWAGLLCPECGAVLDGGPHREGCPATVGRS